MDMYHGRTVSIWGPMSHIQGFFHGCKSSTHLIGNTDQKNISYPVGGVRIEDDILITSKGYENLTTAPKGDEALDIINGEDDKSMPDSQLPWWRKLW